MKAEHIETEDRSPTPRDVTIRVVGDGVAGTLIALALRRSGAGVVLHGDRVAATGSARTLVHRHAGRSFQTDALEDAAWPVAVEFLRSLMNEDAVRELEMVRPVQERLGSSLETAADAASIRRADHPVLGDVFRYGPAFAIDVQATLEHLHARAARAGVVHRGRLLPDESVGERTVVAVGAALPDWVAGLDLQLQGGHLVTFSGRLDHAISARGVHVVPSGSDAICAGSTWWDPAAPLPDTDAIADLRRRLVGAGIDAGDALSVWRGVRCIHATDRRPVVGRLDQSDTWIVGALGTRGWLWAPWLAERLTAAMLHGEPLPERLLISRTAATRATG